MGGGGEQQGYSCGLAVRGCSRAEGVDCPSLAQPLDHLLQLAATSGLGNLDGQRDRIGHEHWLASVRRGGRRGGGRLRWRCVLPDELRDGRVELHLSPLQGGVTVLVDQLSVGLGTQQRLHARLVPSVSGHHQGGGALDVLLVGVGGVLQQYE